MSRQMRVRSQWACRKPNETSWNVILSRDKSPYPLPRPSDGEDTAERNMRQRRSELRGGPLWYSCIELKIAGLEHISAETRCKANNTHPALLGEHETRPVFRRCFQFRSVLLIWLPVVLNAQTVDPGQYYDI